MPSAADSKASPSLVCLTHQILPLLEPSATFAIFSPWPQPLADCLVELQTGKRAVMLQLQESWMRPHQVPRCEQMAGRGICHTASQMYNSFTSIPLPALIALLLTSSGAPHEDPPCDELLWDGRVHPVRDQGQCSHLGNTGRGEQCGGKEGQRGLMIGGTGRIDDWSRWVQFSNLP